MESYIQISKINDFLYSPESLYLHSVYESFNQNMYHESAQKVGKINHECIESGTYSSLKKYLQGTAVYSEKYNIGGKIDLFDKETGSLIERKTKVKSIHDGYVFQLYAQMFCLQEAGYKIKHLFLHSLTDNKRYKIDLPNREKTKIFKNLLSKMRKYDPTLTTNRDESSKFRCDVSIYRHLSY